MAEFPIREKKSGFDEGIEEVTGKKVIFNQDPQISQLPLICTGQVNLEPPLILFPKRQSAYTVTPYGFASEPKLAEKVFQEIQKGNFVIHESFLRTPPNTAAFFAEARVNINELKRNNTTGFFTPQDLKELNDNLIEEGLTQTRFLAPIIIDNYGKISISKIFPSGLDDYKKIWQIPSRIFAQRCSGEVLAVIGEKEGKIWRFYEKPALLDNKNVSVIIEVAPQMPQTPKQLIFPNGLQQDILDIYDIKIKSAPNHNAIFVLNFDTDLSKQGHEYTANGRETIILRYGKDFAISPQRQTVTTRPLQLLHSNAAVPKQNYEIQPDI